jgi:uncharacterized protein (TIGR02145 family)
MKYTPIIKTARLELRPTSEEDAAFILELLNSPKWIQNIGNRQVQTMEDAKKYIQERMLPQVERLGFGNFTLVRIEDGKKVGTCGLYDREGLEGVDIGFALLPAYERMGYAFESAQKLMQLAEQQWNLPMVQGITIKNNTASQKLLEKLGLQFIEYMHLPNDAEELMLYRRVFGRVDNHLEDDNPLAKKKPKFQSKWLTALLLGSLLILQSCAEENPVVLCTDGITDARDGQTYCTAVIGTQEWLLQNMRFQQEGGFENPNNPNTSREQYGLLYTYEAAQKACPAGWHLPTDEEWKTLEKTLGMGIAEVEQIYQRGTNQGQQLKDQNTWEGETNTNDYQFTALPAGEYNPSYGPYFNLGKQASFCTATRSDTSGGVWVRVLKSQEQGITRTYYSELSGHACRCVAD